MKHTLFNGVMAAQQILVLFVQVRILVEQQTPDFVRSFYFIKCFFDYQHFLNDYTSSYYFFTNHSFFQYTSNKLKFNIKFPESEKEKRKQPAQENVGISCCRRICDRLSSIYLVKQGKALERENSRCRD